MSDTSETGTYVVDGNQITLNYTSTDDTGATDTDAETDEFCVSGSALTVAESDGPQISFKKN